MANAKVYPGTVKARSTGTLSASSEQTYTVTVHGDSGDFDVPNARPWNSQWPDNILTEPYPLSTVVVAIDLAGQMIFLFPAQRPKMQGCP